MELGDAIRRRRMCRDFTDEQIAPEVLDRMLDLARRVPSAGYSQGFSFFVLEGADTSRFWNRTMPVEEQTRFIWPGLLRAPVLVLPLAHSDTYINRYSEPDKIKAGLGTSAESWPIPYWYTDCAMAVQNLLLACTAEGLGALYFGIFRNEPELLRDLGIPVGHRPIGAVALGWPTASAGASRVEGSAATRARRPIGEVVHRGRW